MANDTQRPLPDIDTVELGDGCDESCAPCASLGGVDAGAIVDIKPEILDHLINEERLRFKSLDGRYINNNEIKPAPEVDAGLDNDCDGRVDDDFPPEPRIYKGPDDTFKVGVCRAKVEICENNKPYFFSTPSVRPTPEVCDGRDDDCDGR